MKTNGGRKHALEILSKIKDFKNYNNDRNFPIRNTTYLAAHLHFTTVSIR
jgi:deoxyribodipyrimidine photo-lyase